MSSTEEPVETTSSLPVFDLDYGFDDPDDPKSVTVFAPDAEDVATTWLSIDARYAIPLEDVA